MKVTVWYWVKHYSEELGWKQGDIVDLTLDILKEVSDKYDIAFMTRRTHDVVSNKLVETKLLAIDEKYRGFRQR